MLKIQRLFDVSEYAEKARAALIALEKAQQPGEISGKGSKSDVLQMIKSELQELMKKGYTTKQIAEAFKADVFPVLPKTITEITGHNRTTKTKNTAKKTRAKTVEKPHSEEFSQPNKSPDAEGSFALKPDSDDL